MAGSSAHNIKGGNHRGLTFDIGSNDDRDVIYGGAFFHKCVINFHGAAFEIADANFLDCEIKLVKPVVDVPFLESVFERCTFEGVLKNCQFGFRRGQSKTPNGYYRNCDFSKSNLDMCRFFTGDVESVTWPKWPNVTVINPYSNREDWLAIRFPEELKPLAESIFCHDSNRDNEPLAVALSLSGDAVELERVRDALRSKRYVFC